MTQLVTILQLNTEAVDVLSFESPTEFSTIAVPLLRQAIDPVIAVLQQNSSGFVEPTETKTSTTDGNHHHQKVGLDLEIVGSLDSHLNCLPDLTSLRMYDAAFYLSTDSEDDGDFSYSALHRALRAMDVSQLEVVCAVLVYNLALTHHLIGVADGKLQTGAFRTALQLYEMVLVFFQNRHSVSKNGNSEAMDEITSFLCLAAVTNMAHIQAVWINPQHSRNHLLQAYHLVHFLQMTKNKPFGSDDLLANCLTTNFMLDIPGELYAPSA